MKDKKNLKNLTLIIGLIGLAAVTRLLPHPPNFTPLAGMALFAAAVFKQRWLPYVLVFAAYFFSDFILNNLFLRAFYPQEQGLIWFTSGWMYIYGAMALIIGLGSLVLRKVSWMRTSMSAIGAAFIFYFISNIGVWLMPAGMYSQDLSGLVACYLAGLPFLGWTILGNLFFSYILFGSYSYMTKSDVNIDWGWQKA